VDFCLADYELTFNAETHNLDSDFPVFCDYGPGVEGKRRDLETGALLKKTKDLCVFFPPLSSTYSSNKNSIHISKRSGSLNEPNPLHKGNKTFDTQFRVHDTLFLKYKGIFKRGSFANVLIETRKLQTDF
jgi:hypothetical protein